MTILATNALPSPEGLEVVVPAPDAGPGNWSGAASAVLVDGVFWLTYRVRRPLGVGRGVSVVVARSDDGVRFSPVAEVQREAFGTESFERPVLVPLPEGGLVVTVGKYVSPKGNAIHGKGLEPTVSVEPEGEDEVQEGQTPKDLILEKALEVLKGEAEKKKAA